MTDHRDSKPEETPEPQQLGAPETTPEYPQRPEPSTEPSQDQRRALIDADLKSARTLSTVAAIAGPVSFIIGGVMLSTVGLVCAIVGFVKIKHVIDDVDGRQKVYAATVRQTLIWGLAISAIALIVNIVGIALMMPVLMEAMQTGDFTSILGEGATITAQPSGGSGNAWGITPSIYGKMFQVGGLLKRLTRKADNMDYVKSKSRSTIQGFLVVLAALLTLSIGMVGLAGCSGGTSDEDAIRASLASELDSIKNIDDAFVNELSESIDMSQLSVYGIDGVEFMKSYLSGFDYAIDSINVDGDSATAQITLTSKSYTGYLQALQTAVDEVTADPDALAALSNDEINQKIGEIVIGSLDGVELAATQPITITYTKVDGTWEPASSTSGDIAAALMTN